MNMKKESFLEMIKAMSVEDINKIIEQKGKEPKLIKAMFTVVK